MQRRLVVAVPGGELGWLREHHLVLADPVVGLVTGDVLHLRPAGLNHLPGVPVGVPFGPRLCETRLQLQSVGLLDIEHRVLLTNRLSPPLFLVDRPAVRSVKNNTRVPRSPLRTCPPAARIWL